jgi:hypothetical protein
MQWSSAAKLHKNRNERWELVGEDGSAIELSSGSVCGPDCRPLDQDAARGGGKLGREQDVAGLVSFADNRQLCLAHLPRPQVRLASSETRRGPAWRRGSAR